MFKKLSLLILVTLLALSAISCSKKTVDQDITTTDDDTNTEIESSENVEGTVPNPETLPSNPPAR